MASRELSLFVDLDQSRLVQGFLTTIQATLPNFVFGDSVPISFRPLKSNGSNSVNPWSEVDLTGKTVRVAIGNPAGSATSGTFTLSYGGDTTSAISYDADGSTIQTALNALTSITSAGGVTVTRSSTGAFRIVFNTAGARTAITSDPSLLYPSSGAEIRVAIEGDVSTKEIVVTRFESLPAAYAELSDSFPAAAADIVELRTGVVGNAAVKASTTLSLGDGTTNGDDFDIGAVTFTLVTSAANENEITIGANDTETTANILAKINTHSTITAEAVALTATSLTVRAKTAGTAGNAITVDAGTSSITFGGATLSGGLNYVAAVAATQSLEFTVIPYSGSYSLEVGGEQTLGIPWDANAATVEAALELLSTVGDGKVVVTGDFPKFTFNFSSTLGDVGAMTIDLTGLIVPEGRSGVLSTNTAGMLELLNGAASATAKFEIELYDDFASTTWTVLQAECTVIDDVIGNAAASVTGGPEYVTTNSVSVNPDPDTIVKRDASGFIEAEAFIQTGTSQNVFTGDILLSSAGIRGSEKASEPSAPSSNAFEIFAIDNGSGKTVLKVRFATGASQQIAIEP